MESVFKTEHCTGCRACELACSYHHHQIFSPGISSIHIQKDEREAEFGIRIYRKPEKGHLACNCPAGDQVCLNFCAEKARDELNAIIEGRVMAGKAGE